jgi:hypothetical protein
MKLLTDVDGDEVSLVKRAANRRRFLLLKGDDDLDNELSDILDVPWEREGALLDEIRKDGIADETVEKAVIAAVRLLKGVESEFSPELIEKLGTEMYGISNPKLNTSRGGGEVELFGDGDGAPMDGSASGPEKDGSARDGELIGHGDTQPKVANDAHPADCTCADCQDDDDMAKADFSDEERKSLAGKGQALPDGSYPIRNTDDLGNAIKAYGRASDKGRAKSWIIRRAKALGATGMLPDSWSVSKADTDDTVDDEATIDEGGTMGLPVPVKKEDGSWDLSGVPDEARPFFEEMISKADKTETELQDAREQLAKADDTLRSKEMLAKAASYSHVAPADDLAPILKEAHEKLDPETFEKLDSLLTAAEERIMKGDLFAEKGKASGVNDGTTKSDAYATAVEKAGELVEKSDKPLSQDQALAKVWEQNPDLYNAYLAESGLGVNI